MEDTKLYKNYYDNADFYQAEKIEYLIKMKYDEIKKKIYLFEKHNKDENAYLTLEKLENEKNMLYDKIKYIEYIKKDTDSIKCKCGRKIKKKSYYKHIKMNIHNDNI